MSEADNGVKTRNNTLKAVEIFYLLEYTYRKKKRNGKGIE